jgi:xylan 1,4-beta-xylosidase
MAMIKVNFDSAQGQIKPLHGVNNGPVGYGEMVDVSHRYREIGVPYVRLHDPNWPHPREVDIPQVFPNFDADPDDPRSYDFSQTDDYIQRILDVDAKITYRLGVSIEHTKKKYYVHPPADFSKWARICVGIIRHYNEGWAEGMQNAVEYWEIWNEADLDEDVMWTGTFDEYLELYRVAATTIRAACPNVKVGGPAAAYIQGDVCKIPRFLDFVKKHDLPLDFFSWHTYANHPSQIVDNARRVQTLLSEYGYGDIESHLNEWNYFPPVTVNVWAPGEEYARREAFEQQKSEIGASFAAATLIALQDEKVDVANYYDGQPMALYCGLFDYYGVSQKTFQAFKAFHELLDYPERAKVKLTDAGDNLWVLAAVDKAHGKAALLISHFGGEAGNVKIDLEGLSDGKEMKVQVLLLDHDHDLEMVQECVVGAGNAMLKVELQKHAVALVKVE